MDNQGNEKKDAGDGMPSESDKEKTIRLRNFIPRLYQQTIFATAAEKNTLVVLPTGLGKTAIALMLAVKRLNDFPNSKVLILSPTRPLAEQHIKSFNNFLDIADGNSAVFTGFMPPNKREKLWKELRIISSTPQGFENDIISGKINLKEVSLIIFDEAHRAVGDYSYNFIAKAYQKKAEFPRILALTASPGSTEEKIKEVCKNLFIEGVEIRNESDPDVKPYVQRMDIEWVPVVLPPDFLQIRKYLMDCFNSKIDEINSRGFIGKLSLGLSRRELLEISAKLHASLASGEKDYMAMQAVSLLAEGMKVQHALEMLETQGISQLYQYFRKLEDESVNTKVKAVKKLVVDLNFRSAYAKTRILYEGGIEHPKIAKLREIINAEVSGKKDIKIIIFTQYRDSATKIFSELNSISGVTPNIFVGQAKKKDTGMNQKEQKAILEKFGNGEFNTMIATSVGEEGLDIPQVDLVIFYEPIPSAIRTIQRRGRTGRQEAGRVIVLFTKNTRDEAYRWSAFHKEKRMKRTIEEIRSSMSIKSEHNTADIKPSSIGKEKKDSELKDFMPEGEEIKMIVDHREKSSSLVRELSEAGIRLQMESLDIADYVLSSRVAVEIKRVQDFVDSIIDGRLLSQIRSMKENYEHPLIIIEGTEDIYSARKIHPNAIRGMLSTIIIDYAIPIIQTRNFRESAAMLTLIARREQIGRENGFSAHAEKRRGSLREQQEYIVSSLPGIGSELSRNLLSLFGSVKAIVNASEDELKKAKLIGEKKAKGIRQAVDSEYEKKDEGNDYGIFSGEGSGSCNDSTLYSEKP
ncbi:MAG: DEAD/DEAH box helicase [Candidatus Woesearchaeota archaeon]|nr:DEAD/DEAH box helicase [Candidatus Woesearchaeota archaeon]